MARLNTRTSSTPVYTHEGAKAQRISPELELRRSVMTCMLWENTFYESGSDIANRISALVQQVDPEKVCEIARDARHRMYLRHVPLLLACELAKRPGPKPYLEELLSDIIQRADEPGEFLSMYWRDAPNPRPKGFRPIASSVKRGLAKAFTKFDAYRLAKYNRDSKVKLRDVLFLTHPKPKDAEQAEVWKHLVDGTLESPDTWEVALSAGSNKKETWERLLREGKLGGLAVLRNLRNMEKVNVDESLIRSRLSQGIKKALPFRFIAAAKHVPKMEDAIEGAMLKAVEGVNHLSGSTLLVVDISGSMWCKLSKRSEMDRIDAAAGLTILCREICEKPTIYATAGDDGHRVHATKELPARRGFALCDLLQENRMGLGGGGIFLVQCMDYISKKEKHGFDRVIVLTDEQDCDLKLTPNSAKKLGKQNYIVNVGTYEHGISYGNGWTNVNGWSERIFDFIGETETFDKTTNIKLN